MSQRARLEREAQLLGRKEGKGSHLHDGRGGSASGLRTESADDIIRDRHLGINGDLRYPERACRVLDQRQPRPGIAASDVGAQ